MAHKDQRPCGSCPPIPNPCMSCCPLSSRAAQRLNQQVKKTPSISPLPGVLQSQPCSTRNEQHARNAAAKPSAPPAILLPHSNSRSLWPRTRCWWLGCMSPSPQSIHGDGLAALIILMRYFVSGGQDVVSVHVCTCTIKRKLLLARGQAGTKPHLQSQKRYLSHKGET